MTSSDGDLSFLERLFRETAGDDDEPPRKRIAYLEATAGPEVGRRFEFPSHGTLVIGRDRDCPLRLPEDPSVSRHHCVLEINPPHARVRDLGSSNGTRVNGERVDARDLSPGDEIQVGSTILRFELEGADPVAATIVPGSAGPPEGSHPAETFPGFKLLGKLGEGGQGVVYTAQNTRTGEVVALKTLRPALRQDEGAVKAFLREAENGARIDHPHAVRFLNAGFSRGFFYFVMEKVDGPSLAAHLERLRRPLALEELAPAIAQLVDVLDFAHGRGLIHRDVKPENILLARGAPSLVVKLGDFGLMRSFARSGHSFITATGTGKGTVLHMPPEQVLDAKHVDPRADVYALASTIFQALTLTTAIPFEAAKDPIRALLEEPARPLRSVRPELPAAVEAALARALEKVPARRHAGVRELGRELAAAAEGR